MFKGGNKKRKSGHLILPLSVGFDWNPFDSTAGNFQSSDFSANRPMCYVYF